MLLVLRGLPPTVHRDTTLSIVPAGESLFPSKDGNSSLLDEERKVVICTTITTLQEVTFPAYPSLKKTARDPGEKN
jgi:hypothetical protein